MQPLQIASVLLVSAACASAPAPEPTAAVVALGAESATFTLRQGTNMIATETFRRTDALLDVELIVPSGIRVSYTAQLRPDASVARIDVRQFAPGASASDDPMQRSSGAFQGDSVMLALIQGSDTTTDRRATVAGVVPYINPSPSLMEQIVRRANAIGGARVEVPVWVPSGGGQNTSAIVERVASDSARLTLGSTAILLQVDARGRVLGGSIPSQGLVLERSPAGPR